MGTETYRGTVSRVNFARPDGPWMAGRLKLDDESKARAGRAEVSFSGKCCGDIGDNLEIVGTWTQHPRFGPQLDVVSGLVRMDESPDALVHLLATHADFAGLGPVRARKVVDAALFYGTGEISEALIQHPDLIAAQSGVGIDVVRNAAKVWGGRKTYFDALAVLAEQGWSGGQAVRVMKLLGEGAPGIVKSDPYMLIGRLARFGFRTVDAVARKMGIASTDPMRLAAGVAYCLDRIAQNGSTWTTREGLTGEAVEELKPDSLKGEDLIRDSITDLISAGIVHLDKSPLGTEIVADARLAAVEVSVFERLTADLTDRSVAPISFDGPAAANVLSTLNEGQRAAMHGFAEHRCSVLTGGAGVGKTYTIRAIAETSDENGLKVALCAPSGKAARKIQHATGREAFTIHRLLEPRISEHTGEFVFTRNEDNWLECDLVIVDEISMVDVRLLRSLLAALSPHSRLLLVGDHHQIPSVGPGAILRDILSARDAFPGAVHVLTDIVRQAGVLARNTLAILDGVVSPDDCAAWGIHRTEAGSDDSSAALLAMLVESIATAPEPLEPFGRELDFAWDIQVLSPMRKGPLGTWKLNVHLQKLRQRLLGNSPPEATREGAPPKPLVGDRVIWTKNDYELDLHNGTQAIVLALPKGGSMELFTEDGREVTIPAGKRDRVEVAYAMTIHKSQGSEWPLVILAASSTHWIMHDRNLLYTGASRASEALTIFGDASGIRHFAREQRSAKRNTLGTFIVQGWRPRPQVQPVAVGSPQGTSVPDA